MIKPLHKKAGRPLNVCAYARISVDGDAHEGSLSEQIDFYTALILGNPEWSFCGIYADEGISGTGTAKRAQFIRMVERAKAGQIDVILTKSISRMARNVVDLLTTVRELRLAGCEVVFEREGLSTLDAKCDQMLTIYAKFAEEEAISASRNMKWRYDKEKECGHYTLPPNLYGYGKEGGLPVVKEDEARWIREMFRMYADGESLGAIQAMLSANKVPTPSGRKLWNPSTIRGILTNEKYAGDCLIQKTTRLGTIGHWRANSGEENQVYVRNGHPPIVDRETYEKCQKIRAERRDSYSEETKGRWGAKGDETFSGFAWCPHCGRYYTNKTNHYNGKVGRKYVRDGSNKAGQVCKKGTTLFQDVLNDAILQELYFMKTNIRDLRKALVAGFTDPNAGEAREKADSLRAEADALRGKLAALEGKGDDFSEAQASELRSRITSLTRDRLALENEMLVSETAEARAKEITDFLKAMPDGLKDAHCVDFKRVFRAVIVRSRDDLVFVVGGPDLRAVPKKAEPIFRQRLKYRVRKTDFESSFGIWVNR